MSIYLDHGVSLSGVQALISDKWIYELSHYVLGCGNRESIAQ